ncbi:MAG TPA: ATP-binding protein [Fontimonas sp.]
MKRPSLKPGLAAQLTALHALIFAIAAAGVIALIVALIDNDLRNDIHDDVAAELEILLADYQIDGLDGVRGFIDVRSKVVVPAHERIYRLEDPQGRRLAGNWPVWPDGLQTDGRILQLDNPRHSPTTQWLIAATRLPDGSRVLAGFDTFEHRLVMMDIYRTAGIALLAALVLSIVAGTLVNRTMLRPIAMIRRSAERIIDGELDHRIPQRGSRDEFDALTATLNRMLDRIHALIEGVRGTTDAIAHDLRSPLTRHRARLEAALATPPAEAAFAGWLQDNLREVDQVLGSFGALLQLATIESGAQARHFVAVDLRVLAGDAVSLYEAEAAAQQMSLSLHCADRAIVIRGDRNLLFQSTINLIDNAVKYGASRQCIDVRVDVVEEDDQCWALLSVSDQGPGIAEADRERIFDRMVRGDQSRRTPGHGLGLSLVRAVAQLHGGHAGVEPSARGACLTLRLPMAD